MLNYIGPTPPRVAGLALAALVVADLRIPLLTTGAALTLVTTAHPLSSPTYPVADGVPPSMTHEGHGLPVYTRRHRTLHHHVSSHDSRRLRVG